MAFARVAQVQPIRSYLSLIFALLCGASLSGCLADSYAIRRDELMRIAALPPENRGTHVRATQQTIFAESYSEPDPLDSEAEGPHGMQTSIVAVSVQHQHVHDYPRYSSDSGPVARPPPERSLRLHRDPLPDARDSRAAARPSRRQPARPSQSGSVPAVGGSGDSDGDSSKGNAAGVAAVVALAALVVETGAFSAVALTEGPRFDGWVWLPSEQPLLLKPLEGAPYWVPLSDVTVAEASLAESGVVLPTKAQLRDRAPLDRVGATMSLELGGSALRSTLGRGNGGFMARYGLGGFPLQWLGMLGNAGLTAGEDGGTLFEGRLGFELRLIPLRLGVAHLGVYDEIGRAWLLHDVPGGTTHGQGLYYGVGALLEIDLTTRLGLLARGGVAWLPLFEDQARTRDDRRPFPELSLGLTVY